MHGESAKTVRGKRATSYRQEKEKTGYVWDEDGVELEVWRVMGGWDGGGKREE